MTAPVMASVMRAESKRTGKTVAATAMLLLLLCYCYANAAAAILLC